MSAEGNKTAPSVAKPPTSRSPSPSPLSSDDGNDRNTYSISQSLFDALVARGFSENAIKKSIVAGCVDESTCTQWIQLHEGHPELDTPMEPGVEVVVKAKRILTEAEREAKVKELQERAKQKKEAETKELQRKERERLDMMRKMAHMKNEMEDVRRKMDIDEARREKAADLEARRRVKIQIVADRLQRKGMSKDEAYATAEREFEEAAERGRAEAAEKLAKLQEAAQPSTAKSTSAPAEDGAAGVWDLSAITAAASAEAKLDTVFAGATPASAEELVASIQQHTPAAQSEECVRTLRLILSNIITDPFDIKKRTLRVSTKAFREAVLPIEDATQLLRWCGFDLSTDATGGHTICLSTVLIRKLRHALALLSR
ncbi:hypothetical protein ABB37_04916 [Leptomonas pyrrhocoris]|uniref:PUB domain-containing protein n=1 Tax=Leptomonas pyrrhocoris TaxID=157538 RepID=A0A0M9G0N0_LEPPY|nr:hypothetical protein ABB37_04916 [Leptomonas pyrrhocoris]KPA79823.1 hypothetical protein ABB37_04916 [Leptomonas pyrrhocoris]|eukprot:XP_015658262.1 hypothetical protein ABB37_04916 [Leptomonas pyrrhocoris]